MGIIYEKNYELLVQLGVIGDGKLLHQSARSQVASMMDLVVEERGFLDGFNNQSCIGVSLAHYFESNGDLCSDPFMEMLVYPETKMVEAYSFEMSMPPVYHEVYPSPGFVLTEFKVSLNDFLSDWLKNLVAQNHGKEWIAE